MCLLAVSIVKLAHFYETPINCFFAYKGRSTRMMNYRHGQQKTFDMAHKILQGLHRLHTTLTTLRTIVGTRICESVGFECRAVLLWAKHTTVTVHSVA